MKGILTVECPSCKGTCMAPIYAPEGHSAAVPCAMCGGTGVTKLKILSYVETEA